MGCQSIAGLTESYTTGSLRTIWRMNGIVQTPTTQSRCETQTPNSGPSVPAIVNTGRSKRLHNWEITIKSVTEHYVLSIVKADPGVWKYRLLPRLFWVSRPGSRLDIVLLVINRAWCRKSSHCCLSFDSHNKKTWSCCCLYSFWAMLSSLI